ncbi:homoserine dehydrogenase [Anaerobacterium chartisolvens]|nr:homoserine dehydrogenase [Anaerobacterium chartisolvens]
MVYIAILGYGTVGSGVLEVIRKNCPGIAVRAGEKIEVKKILDIRDFPESPDKDLLTKNADEVFEDSEISIIVETIGGSRIAYEFTKRALKMGKHVVTSNKEIVAAYGPELLELAAQNGVSYLFEASVGGGIPIIRPLSGCLAANEINAITGILNGTTNYILTQMKREGKDFSEALKEAQQKGYAEADPTADIEGHDACRKIAILSSIAYNEFIDYRQIHTEGISSISLADMQYAEAMDSTVKLIGLSVKTGDKIFARVSPAIVSKKNPISNVDDVFNAIVVKGNAVGETMFYGRGAGKLPTASAVAADVIDIVKHRGVCRSHTWTVGPGDNMIDHRDFECRYFIRLKTGGSHEAESAVEDIFKRVAWVRPAVPFENEIGFVTGVYTERQLEKLLKEAEASEGIEKTLSIIRLLDDGQ